MLYRRYICFPQGKVQTLPRAEIYSTTHQSLSKASESSFKLRTLYAFRRLKEPAASRSIYRKGEGKEDRCVPREVGVGSLLACLYQPAVDTTFDFHQVPKPGFVYPKDMAPWLFQAPRKAPWASKKPKLTLKILVRFPCSGAARAANNWEIEAKNG